MTLVIFECFIIVSLFDLFELITWEKFPKRLYDDLCKNTEKIKNGIDNEFELQTYSLTILILVTNAARIDSEYLIQTFVNYRYDIHVSLRKTYSVGFIFVLL